MIVIAILGLLVPGYALARVLRAPAPWAVAFPLSALVLTEIVVAYTLLGIPIRFGYVLAAVLVAIVAAVAAERRWISKPGPKFDDEPNQASKPLVLLAAALIALALLGILVRTSLYPLSGPDTALRWDALPRLMLEYQSLSYYPPLTAEDFSKYFVPDSFPPMVATIYWWLYAAWGSAWPRLTSVAIVLQAMTCFALVFYAARLLFGRAGGMIALIALSSSALFLDGLAIGQENGMMAISYAGQLLFAFATVREPKAKWVVIAGLFAALGALAREYGPLLTIGGIVVLASRRETRRFLPLFCLVAVACAAPWYIRTWALTGNPIYPMDTGLGLPVNPVLSGMRSMYHQYLSVWNYPAWIWGWGVGQWLLGAPLALLLGLLGIWAAGKQRMVLGLLLLLAMCLWFSSISNTAGGLRFTWRFAMPAWVALSIAAGALGPAIQRVAGRWKGLICKVAGLVFVACGTYAIVCCWSQPFRPSELFTAIGRTRDDPLDLYEPQTIIAAKLEESKLPTAGILTEDCNFAVVLRRKTRFRPVMVWSPEVAFVFHPDAQPGDVRRELLDKNIWLVAVTYESLNNLYLIQFPFYKDLYEHGKPSLFIPQVLTLISLRAHDQKEPQLEPAP